MKSFLVLAANIFSIPLLTGAVVSVSALVLRGTCLVIGTRYDLGNLGAVLFIAGLVATIANIFRVGAYYLNK